MSSPARKTRASLATLLAFVVGLPLGVGSMVWLLRQPKPAEGTPGAFALLYRYCEHPVEQAEVVLFCMAIGALLGKVLTNLKDRRTLQQELVPAWSGQPEPVEQVHTLQFHFARHANGIQNSTAGQRVAGILDFLASRRSANELDDQLRSFSDVDAGNADQSYSLLRFITWAIPILGFLGTVLGITDAIGGVSPEQLENSLSQVTGGLATAFDTTALALGLTMVLMFLSYITEQLESNVLQQIDAYVDRELAHRFERNSADHGPIVLGLRQNADVLMQTSRALVEQQAAIWAQSLSKSEASWTQSGKQQQEKFAHGLQDALELSLQRHTKRLQETEEKILARSQSIFEGLTNLARVLTETSRHQQDALVKVAEKVGAQTNLLAKLQENEGQLLILQQSLQNNLAAVTATGTFEEAVQSLTAAIHLLTTRVQPSKPKAA